MRNPFSCTLTHAAAVTAIAAGFATASDNGVAPLPKQRIESVYRNGDIDSVIFYLKQGREKPMFLDRNDSVLAFKYLGIIYASDKDKREKGRYYFNQMLLLDHGASITELLPGESARTAFREVRDEFFELHPDLVRREGAPPTAARPEAAPVRYNDDADTTVMPPSGPLPQPGSKATAEVGSQRSHKVWWWVAGGAVAAGAAAGVVIAVMDPTAKTQSFHD